MHASTTFQKPASVAWAKSFCLAPLKKNCRQVSLLMAEQGVHTIAYAFPKANIITTAVDPEINDKYVFQCWDFSKDFGETIGEIICIFCSDHW
jgi:hypothetical protein